MPDVFDTITVAPQKDIFDTVDFQPTVAPTSPLTPPPATKPLPLTTKLVEPAKAFTRGIEHLIGTGGSLVQWISEQSPLANTYRLIKAKRILGKLQDESIPLTEKQKLATEFKEGNEWLSRKAEQWADYWQEQASKGWEAPLPEIMQAKWTEMPIAKGAATIAEAVPNYLAAIVSSILTKTPRTGLMFISAVSGAGAYRRQRKAGVGRNMANAVAMLTAAWEYVTEKVPFEAVFKPSKSVLKKMLKISSLEGAQEFVQGIGENFLEYFGYTAKDLDSVPPAIREGVSHALDNWVENVVGGVGLGLIGGGIVRTPPTKPLGAIPAPEEAPAAPSMAEIRPEGIKLPPKPIQAKPEAKKVPEVAPERVVAGEEHIVSAAMKVGKKVFTGNSHVEIIREIVESGELPERFFTEGLLKRKDVDLFLTNKGRLVNLEEAKGLKWGKKVIAPAEKVAPPKVQAVAEGKVVKGKSLAEIEQELEGVGWELRKFGEKPKIFKQLLEIYKNIIQTTLKDNDIDPTGEVADDVLDVFGIPLDRLSADKFFEERPPTSPQWEWDYRAGQRVWGGVEKGDPAISEEYLASAKVDILDGLEDAFEPKKTMIVDGQPVRVRASTFRSQEAIDKASKTFKEVEQKVKGFATKPTKVQAPTPLERKPAVIEKGLTRDELKVVGDETAKMLRQAQLEGAKVGYKIGDKAARADMRTRIAKLEAEKKLSEQVRQETRKLIQDAFGTTVPKKFLTLISKTGSRKDIDRAVAAVEETLEKIEQKQAIKEIRVLSKDIQSRIGKTMQEKGIRPEYAKKLNTLVDSFATKKLSQWRIKDIGNLKNYLFNLKEGISNDSSMDEVYRAKLAEMLIPEKRLTQLDKLSQSSIHLLKAEDIRTITTELKRLVHLNDVKNKLYLGRTARRVSEYLKQAVKEQESVKNESSLPKEETLTTTRQRRGLLKTVGGFVAGVDNHDTKTLAFTIDGGKEGVVAEIFAEGFRYGRRAETDHKTKILKYTRKFQAENNITHSDLVKLSPAFTTAFRGRRGQKARRLVGKQTPTYKVKIAGRQISLTMADMMSVYMHAQSDFNLKAMLKEGVASIIEEKGTLSPEELAVIIRHVESNPKALALTKMYAHIAENINKPAINSVSMDLKGIEIADVENYFTVERFTRGKVAGNQEYQINLLESQGFLQERTGSKNPIVIRDFFAVLMANIDGVSEYVGMAKPFRAAHTLLGYKGWTKAVDGKGHEIQRRHLNTLMERTEQKPKVRGKMEAVFGKVLRGATRSVLAEPGIMAGQIMSEINYHATDIPSKYLLATNPIPSKVEVERATNEFPWMWVRRNLGAASIVTRDISRTDAALRAFTGKKALINLPPQGINYVDMKAITFGRKAVEKWVAKTTNLKGREFVDEVNKRTHKAVSESQPMFETENRSILTSNPNVLAKVFFLFRSYIDQTLRIMSRARTAHRNGVISKTAMANKFGIVFAGFAAYKMLRILVNALLYRRKEDPYEIARDILLSPMRALTVVGYPAERQISRMLDIAGGRRPKTRYFDVGFENLVTSTINEAWDAAKDYGDAVAYLGTDEIYKSGAHKGKLKSEVLLLRATEKMAYAMGKIAGLPTPSLRRFRYGWTEKPERTAIKPRRKAGKRKKRRVTF